MSAAYPQGPIVGEPAAPLMESRRVGGAGYWIGGVSMLVGVVLLAVVSVVAIGRAVEALTFPRVVDSTGGIWIDEPGGYVIFTVRDGRPSTRPVWTSVVEVTDPDGSTIPTAPYTGDRSVTSSSSNTGFAREAYAIATFQAPKPGRYVLGAENLEDGATLGVGEGVKANVVALLLGGIGGAVLVLGGLTLMIVTAVRRSRQRRRSAMAAAGGYPMSQYPTGPYPYAGYWYPTAEAPGTTSGAGSAPVSSSPGASAPPPPPPGWVPGPPSPTSVERDIWGRPGST